MQQKIHPKKKGIAKPQYKNLTAFKTQEKYYKLYHGKQTDFSTLFQPQNFVEINGYQICELPFPNGAYYIPSFTSYKEIIEIGYFGLNHYCKKPYRTNLDSRQQLYQQTQENQNIQQQKHEKQSTNLQKQENIQQTKQQQQQPKYYYFNDKIRWANVGYQYDWTLRKYPDMKTPIHPTIQKLSDRANQLYNEIQHIKKNYQPQSAIINYYGPKDYMTGHLDDAEIDQESPIYSFSFGLSCIFLIGGRNKDQKPTAIKLNSGDLLIMAGESRKCYHGVPRILNNTFIPQSPQIQQQTKEHIDKLSKTQKTQNNFKQIKNYLSSHRININIRQVFPNQ